ncbi:MAG: sigma-70 family RNA polymerase sigma factor [Acidobacteria bacterium]|nr:sigma-70 family RNA polymerase sigma factor [Acidobacteriota bacterium]
MGTAANFMSAQAVAMTPSSTFAELYESHFAAVYRTALRVTGNPADAEDVVQTVFLRVLDREHGRDYARMPEAFFRRAAANAAIDLLRRRRVRAETGLDGAPAPAARETEVLLKERLRRAIAGLQPEDALLFLLRHVEGFTNGELARMFGQDKNNIAVRLHRIRHALQMELER